LNSKANRPKFACGKQGGSEQPERFAHPDAAQQLGHSKLTALGNQFQMDKNIDSMMIREAVITFENRDPDKSNDNKSASHTNYKNAPCS